jgi:hypothetical protein
MWKRTLISAALLLSPSVQAALVPYDVVLQVDQVLNQKGACDGQVQLPAHHLFGCGIQPGDVFTGRFAVDDTLLQRDGDNLNGPIFGFWLKIGTVVWDQDQRSDFDGFRQFVEGDTTGLVRFAAAPSFNIHGGIITVVTGGVLGRGDAPFVDFYNVPLLGRFNAQDDSITHLAGTLTVGRSVSVVPEPGALTLLGVPLLLLASKVFRRSIKRPEE